VKVFKWGRGFGLRLSPELLEATGLQRGDKIVWTVTGDGVAVMSKLNSEGVPEEVMALKRQPR
jgi:antitoxin component of MazEF toxin-antitoxin module